MSRHLGTVVFGAIVLVLIGTAVVIINVGPRAPVPKVDPVVALNQARTPAQEDAVELYAAAIAALSGPKPYAPPKAWRYGDPLPEPIVTWVEDDQDALELARRAAELPVYHQPVTRDRDGLVSLPHLDGMKKLAALCGYQLDISAEDRDLSAFTQWVCVLNQMGRHIQQTPTLYSHMVGQSVLGCALQDVLRPFTWNTLTADERAEYAAAIEPCFEPPAPLAAALQFELDETVWMCKSAPGIALSVIAPTARISGELTRLYEPIFALAELPVQEQLDPNHPVCMRALASGTAKPPVWQPPRALAATLMPQHQYVVDSRARFIVCQQGNHTAIQVLLHRDRTGALPASLSDLSTSPFIDPYSGKPFAYVPRDGDFTLYSIGHDGRDDGGRHSSRALRDPLGDRVFWPLSARFEAEGE